MRYWSVTVSVDGKEIVTIEPSMLSGTTDLDEFDEELREAARHLMAFAGSGDPDVSIVGDEE